MSNTEKTIKDDCIWVYPYKKDKPVAVRRLSRRQMLKCVHEWCQVSYSHRGHGKWQSGCIKCGALARG